jgi:hypothetical protein
MRSVTHKTQVPDLRPRTARRHGGTTAAAAPPVAQHPDIARVRKRANAQERLPAAVGQEVLDGISAGRPFCTVLRDLGLTPNQVWGLTKTDQDWSEKLDAALTATSRDDLKHGPNAAYVQGCVCSECREHQRIRMGRNRRS